MHLASGDRQMDTEMNCLRKLELVGQCNLVFLNRICCGLNIKVVILTGSNSLIPGYTEIQVFVVYSFSRG